MIDRNKHHATRQSRHTFSVQHLYVTSSLSPVPCVARDVYIHSRRKKQEEVGEGEIEKDELTGHVDKVEEGTESAFGDTIDIARSASNNNDGIKEDDVTARKVSPLARRKKEDQQRKKPVAKVTRDLDVGLDDEGDKARSVELTVHKGPLSEIKARYATKFVGDLCLEQPFLSAATVLAILAILG